MTTDTKKDIPAIECIVGNEAVKRAIEIAAVLPVAKVLIVGPSGCGKSTMVKAYQELCRSTPIVLSSGDHIGRQLTDGEGELLIAEDLPEFPRASLQTLREVVERQRKSLIATMSLCACGARGQKERTCSCSRWKIQRYFDQVPPGLYGEFDITIRAEAPHIKEVLAYLEGYRGESADRVLERIDKAKELLGGISISEPAIDDHGRDILRGAFPRFGLSMNQLHKVLRIARVCAALEEEHSVKAHHVSEALLYPARIQTIA